MLQVLNTLFFIFHTFWILLILFGWLNIRTLRMNLYAIILTAVSWIGLGYWYGWGYCLCTDWHWQVRQRLGIADQTNNYVHLLISNLTGLSLSSDTVMFFVAIVFLISTVMSVSFNFRAWKNRV